MVASAPAAGTRSLPVLAKYDVIEEIGHGGMATVYRAMDKRLQREVAVKVIHPHLRESTEVAHRFVVEAQAVAKLRHTNIVEVFDVSADDDPEKFLVVELIRGATLRKLLKDQGPLPPEIAASLAVDILAALAHAHAEGVVHRDVKPENVLIEHRSLRSDGPDTPPPTSGDAAPRVRVKLTDFGIAKLLDAQGVTSTGQVLGSPAHMAPEQIEGGDVDARADVFGMGVLLYEAMVGHLPFEGQNPAQVLRRVLEGQYPQAEMERGTVGKRLSTILDRALAHDANDRFESANAMRDALLVELKRVGVDSHARELEAYFDDPEGYTKDHAKRTIAKLCDLAQVARKEDRSLDAASDYNRALAYAPDDPQLLRIVARMQKDAARAAFIKRAWPLALLAIVVLVGAYFGTQALKNRTQPIASTNASTAASTVASANASTTASTTTSAVTSATATTTTAKTTAATGTAVVQHVERTITLNVLPASFFVSDNGREPENHTTGDPLKLDEKEHVLRFTCPQDLCEPQTRKVAVG
ncbi:MAG TPA: serine/threonine-protein kinase, partial [Polyangiaceae bacterium]|nr:serine/threonine-protein kinase [Polyangiaceae bacterium]